jgi:hypothetical protein
MDLIDKGGDGGSDGFGHAVIGGSRGGQYVWRFGKSS